MSSSAICLHTWEPLTTNTELREYLQKQSVSVAMILHSVHLNKSHWTGSMIAWTPPTPTPPLAPLPSEQGLMSGREQVSFCNTTLDAELLALTEALVLTQWVTWAWGTGAGAAGVCSILLSHTGHLSSSLYYSLNIESGDLLLGYLLKTAVKWFFARRQLCVMVCCYQLKQLTNRLTGRLSRWWQYQPIPSGSFTATIRGS